MKVGSTTEQPFGGPHSPIGYNKNSASCGRLELRLARIPPSAITDPGEFAEKPANSSDFVR